MRCVCTVHQVDLFGFAHIQSFSCCWRTGHFRLSQCRVVPCAAAGIVVSNRRSVCLSCRCKTHGMMCGDPVCSCLSSNEMVERDHVALGRVGSFGCAKHSEPAILSCTCTSTSYSTISRQISVMWLSVTSRVAFSVSRVLEYFSFGMNPSRS